MGINLINDNLIAANARARFNYSSSTAVNEGADIPFPNTDYLDGMSYSSGVVTIEAKGFYRITSGIRWDNGSIGTPSIVIRKNASNANTSSIIGGSAGTKTDIVTSTVECLVGDTISIRHNSSNPTETLLDSSYFEVVRVPDFSAGQPAGFGVAADGVYGLTQSVLIQKKNLTSFSTTGIMTDLTMNNLEVGKYYRANTYFESASYNSTSNEVDISLHNAATNTNKIADVFWWRDQSIGGNARLSGGFTIVFQATQTTAIIYMENNQDSLSFGGSCFFQLEELSSYETTTKFT